MGGFVAGLTPSTITVDGDLSDWDLDSQMASGT